MFSLSYFKKNLKGGEEKMKKAIVLMLALVLVAGSASVSFAASSKTLNVQATVPATSGAMAVNVAKVRASDNTVVEQGANITIMDIGNLVSGTGTAANVYLADYYYYVDISVVDNTSTIWSLTHTRGSLQRSGGSETLDNNFNVIFKKVSASNGAGVELSKVSYANSNNIAYTKNSFTDMPGSWLRIIYGVATGSGDASGAGPIVKATAVAGTYSGTVTITLTP